MTSITLRPDAPLFVLKNGDKYGPFDEQAIHHLLRDGKLQESDWVWQEGLTQWHPLRTIISATKSVAIPTSEPEVILQNDPTYEVDNPSGSPIHILAALITMVLDMVWSAPKILLSLSGVGLPVLILCSFLVGGICCVGVTLVQRNLVGEEWSVAFTKGFGLAVLSGVPFPFLGTTVGTLFLGWAGIRGVRRPMAKSRVA